MINTTSVPVAIVGGGQAGLTMSAVLNELRIEHVVFEKDTAMHVWSDRCWDTFCLVTPNWQCDLPGHRYEGADPDGFMMKDELVAWLAAFRAKVDPPILEHTAVHRVAPRDGGFALDTDAGAFTAGSVVVASGGYTTPIIPSFAGELPETIVQLHSEAYRSAAALPDGAVVVVGSGQSGTQIAEDLHLAGRKVHLAVGGAPRCARSYRGKDVVRWLDLMGYYAKSVDDHPLRDGVRDSSNHYVTGRDGGRDIDLRRFAAEGMSLYGMLDGFDGARLTFRPTLGAALDAADATYNSINAAIDAFIDANAIAAPPPSVYSPVWTPDREPAALDLAAAGVAAVIWAIGFRPDFGVIEAPVFSAAGHPIHRRGVTEVPGLYFLGLPWLHSWGSGRFSGVAADARFLASAIAADRAAHDELSLRAGAAA